ncbi:hypothetical protein SDC9_200481 [bioreactor metagenome]|uniref:Uncharacterized protein n=1 Tax=bioreactor metagenome TaxID=1076179 RepID=A0A645INB8_9ZZZZ
MVYLFALGNVGVQDIQIPIPGQYHPGIFRFFPPRLCKSVTQAKPGLIRLDLRNNCDTVVRFHTFIETVIAKFLKKIPGKFLITAFGLLETENIRSTF